MPAEDTPVAAFKDIFDAARFRSIARELKSIDPAFDDKVFLKSGLKNLEDLSLMQRMRRISECLHASLPSDYSLALERLRALAPRMDKSFATMVLPDFVGCYGLEDFAVSMEALKFFTPFCSSEFGIREFLRRDLNRTLKVMEKWSRDPDEHVRRLSSEGCRPRLPWSFHLEALTKDPTPVLPILNQLKCDPSLYVRKSVANHLNDITKNHPDLVLDLLKTWPQEDPRTAWITRHALRSLIKAGHAGALALVGATGKAEIHPPAFAISPRTLNLGGQFTMTASLRSSSRESQRLVVDYAVHYVKKSGQASAKVFKWKTVDLAPGSQVQLTHRQTIRNFTTRVHYPGRHRVTLLINGAVLAEGWFDLIF